MGYWSDLVSSFEPGGQTPFQALLGVPESVDGLLDYWNYHSEVEENAIQPWALILGDDEAVSRFNEKVSTNSADVLIDEDSYIDDLLSFIISSSESNAKLAQSSADRAMEFSAEQAQLNRDFQERMSNTAYQRAMADLKAAGINPKLVAQLGGASTPAGSSASGTAANFQMANFQPIASVLSSYITSAASLDNKDKDFVQSLLNDLVYIFLALNGKSIPVTNKIGF